MKNKLADLNNHLFAQLERLSDESMTAEQIEMEAQRADAIVDVATSILKNADVHLRAATLLADHGLSFQDALPVSVIVNGGRNVLTHGD